MPAAASTVPAPVVFISYSSKDSTTAEQVCAHLETAGIRCWIAPRDIPTGVEYADGIVAGIDAARVMVLVFSPASNESSPVRREVELASHRGIPILPIMIERTVPTGGMEYYLRSRQWRSAFAGPLADSLGVLEGEVRAHLSANPQFDPTRRVWRRLLNQLGGATLIFLFLIATAAATLWVTRASLVPDERRLVVAGLLVALLSWPMLRWQGVFNSARKVLAIKAVLLTVFLGGWTAAAIMAHRTPPFRRGPGILVARIAGNGDQQPWLVAKLQGYIQAGGRINEDIEVKALPRRVSSTLEAQRYARASGAMVVLWGSVTAGLLQVSVTMADGEGIYDAADAPILANKDLEVEDAVGHVEDAVGHVEDVLVMFLGAQRLYQKKQFAAALERLDLIPAVLSAHESTAGQPVRLLTPVEATLSTVHFYCAMTRYQLVLKTGDRSIMPQVIADYNESIRYATLAGSAGSVSGFATPVANLAGILLSSGRADDIKTAADLLERTECGTRSAFAPIPCLYIEYQRAVLHNIRGRYADGRTTFDQLLTKSWPEAALPESSPHRLLMAYAYRNRAYSNARLGDTNPAANRQDYERADRDWMEAERIFTSIGVPPPPLSYLTRARIQIGLGHVKEARAALDTAIAGGTDKLGELLVQATIASCVGDVAARDGALGTYLVTLRKNRPDDFEKLKRDADRQLAAFSGLCRTSQEVRQ